MKRVGDDILTVYVVQTSKYSDSKRRTCELLFNIPSFMFLVLFTLLREALSMDEIMSIHVEVTMSFLSTYVHVYPCLCIELCTWV